MRLPAGLAVGVCSHTGFVRNSNEDDYLLATGSDGASLLAAIADGMGGVAGGAEASRTALRALGATMVDAGVADDAAERLRHGFRSASERVHEAAVAVPALRDMGTTLTALWLLDGEAVVGHVGDTRLYRLRDGVLEALTTDHVARQGESLLTRCVGAGQPSCESDEVRFALLPGDRFLLATDGVWNVVPPAELESLLSAKDAQAAAEALVLCALDHGGPDNATAVIVDVTGHEGPAVDVELPRHEPAEAQLLWPRAESLRAPLWPWLLLVGGLALSAHAGLRLAGIDTEVWFRSLPW